jgi:hypothetical protein
LINTAAVGMVAEIQPQMTQINADLRHPRSSAAKIWF